MLEVIELTARDAAPLPRSAAHRRVRCQPARRRARPVRVEDAEQIVPAIEAARAAGIDASGPHPADTVFHPGRASQAVRRDRVHVPRSGAPPMKLLAFDSGVNVTLGLPIIRTSVDHGTAFDIAWQGVAFTGSLDHALRWARRLTSNQ